MTRLGPLTSQALGRSPYDIVVPGEGEADPHSPPQSYDDRGRPVNPETKRINRDIVRSHNEVMHVIGVAEPDSGILAADAEAERRMMQQHHEDQVGRQLTSFGRMLGIAGVWGVNAMRQRILLYRQYSEIPFQELFHYEFSRRPLLNVVTTGLPVFVTSHTLRQVASLRDIRDSFWKRSTIQFVRLHLQIFLCLQRMEIVPADPWFPGPLYFVPFSSESPIRRPPPLPTSLTVRSAAQWVGLAVLNFAPVAAFYGYTKLWAYVTHYMYGAIFAQMPNPTNSRWHRITAHEQLPASTRRMTNSSPNDQPSIPPPTPPPPPPPPPPQAQQPRPDQQSSTSRDDSRRNALEIEGVAVGAGFDQSAQIATTAGTGGTLEGSAGTTAASSSETHPLQQSGPRPPPPPPGSPTAVRRRNTMSSRGGDEGYISEEEEFELSATLISFDVEAADAGDTVPNAWSAELRQSTSVGGPDEGGGGRIHGGGDPDTYNDGIYYESNGGPVYADNVLTRLPALIATDVVTVVAASAAIAPYEAFVIRLVARAYRQRHGLPVNDLYGLNVLSLGRGGSLSLTSVTNFFVLGLAHLMIEMSCWLVTTGLAWLYRDSEPGWSFFRVVKEKLGFGERKIED